jgi:hypothetical protein
LNDELLHRWCQRASLHRSHSVSRSIRVTGPWTARHERMFCNRHCKTGSCLWLYEAKKCLGTPSLRPACRGSIRRSAHHTNTCSGAPHTRRSPSAPCTACATWPVSLCSSSRRSKTPPSSSLPARSTRTVRRCLARRRGDGPARCWHVRSTASHRWSGRRPAAVSSQVVADAGRQAGETHPAGALQDRESRRPGCGRGAVEHPGAALLSRHERSAPGFAVVDDLYGAQLADRRPEPARDPR